MRNNRHQKIKKRQKVILNYNSDLTMLTPQIKDMINAGQLGLFAQKDGFDSLGTKYILRLSGNKYLLDKNGNAIIGLPDDKKYDETDPVIFKKD